MSKTSTGVFRVDSPSCNDCCDGIVNNNDGEDKICCRRPASSRITSNQSSKHNSSILPRSLSVLRSGLIDGSDRSESRHLKETQQPAPNCCQDKYSPKYNPSALLRSRSPIRNDRSDSYMYVVKDTQTSAINCCQDNHGLQNKTSVLLGSTSMNKNDRSDQRPLEEKQQSTINYIPTHNSEVLLRSGSREGHDLPDHFFRVIKETQTSVMNCCQDNRSPQHKPPALLASRSMNRNRSDQQLLDETQHTTPICCEDDKNRKHYSSVMVRSGFMNRNDRADQSLLEVTQESAVICCQDNDSPTYYSSMDGKRASDQCCGETHQSTLNYLQDNHIPLHNSSMDKNDRSDHYIRLLKETQQSVSNRDVLISMLQSQLKKMEDLYKKSLDDHQDVRLKYSAAVQELTSLRIIFKRIEEENVELKNKYRMANKQVEELNEYKAESEKALKKKEYEELSKTLDYMDKSTSAMQSLLNTESVGNDKTCTGLLIEHCGNIENLLALQNEKLNAILNNTNTKVEPPTKDPTVDEEHGAKCCEDEDPDTSNLKLSLEEARREVERLKVLDYKVPTKEVSCTTSRDLMYLEPKPETVDSCCAPDEIDKTSVLAQETQTDNDKCIKNEIEIQELRNKCELIVENSEKEQLKMRKNIKQLEDKVISLKADHNKDLINLDQTKRSNESLQGKLVLMNQTLHQYKEQAKLSKTEIDQWMSRVAELEGTVARLEAMLQEKDKGHGCQMERNKSALSEISAKYDVLRKEYDILLEKQHDIDVLKNENANLIQGIEEKEDVIESLRQKVCALECELDDLRHQMLSHSEKASQDIKELQSTCCALETQLFQTQAVLQKEEEKSLEEAQETLPPIVSDSSKNIEQLEGMKQVHSKIINLQFDEILCLKKQLVSNVEDAELQTTVQQTNFCQQIESQLNIEIDNLRKRNETLQQRIVQLEEEVDLRKHNERKAQMEVETAASEKKDLQKELTAFGAVKKDNEKMSREIVQLKAALGKLKESHKDAVTLDRKNNELFVEIETMRTEIDSYKRRLDNANRELQEEVRKREAEVKSCRGILSTIQETDEVSKDAEKHPSRISKPNPTCYDKDLKVDAHFTVLYNNQKYKSSTTESTSVTSNGSSSSRTACSNKFERLQKRLTCISQMEKQVEDMIGEVRRQNEKLYTCNLARLQNEKEIERRLNTVKMKKDNLMADFRSFHRDVKGNVPQCHNHPNVRPKHAHNNHSSCACPHTHNHRQHNH